MIIKMQAQKKRKQKSLMVSALLFGEVKIKEGYIQKQSDLK